MMEFCLHPERILSMLDEIGRTRALTEEETDIIEAIICRGHKSNGIRFKWTPKLDRELMKAAISRGGIRHFADKHGMTQKAAHCRVEKLRRKKEAKRG